MSACELCGDPWCHPDLHRQCGCLAFYSSADDSTTCECGHHVRRHLDEREEFVDCRYREAFPGEFQE